ncbi:hypothetical protein LTR94_023419 [Friedmanniomyces endolithicus]|nr:hypothetical protein LTR94_023419 [Friedmanniomyces endolithicus]
MGCRVKKTIRKMLREQPPANVIVLREMPERTVTRAALICAAKAYCIARCGGCELTREAERIRPPQSASTASNFVCRAVPSNPDVRDNLRMPKKASPHPKPTRRPTFIRAWRKDRGLTLAQLQDQLLTLHGIEISEGQLSRIENAKSPYAQDLLEAIADVLQTEPASLIMRDPSQRQFWSIYDTLDPVQRQQVVAYADFIKKRA